MDLRTDRKGVLLDQFAISRDMAFARLDGLTDAEFFREPVPGCWSLRRREDAVSPMAYGAGEWVVDFALPEPEIPPFTTIAWRLAHLLMGLELRWEWSFGGRTRRWDDLVLPGTADGMLAALRDAAARWEAGLAGCSEGDLDTVGFSQFPGGLDPHVPFIGIAWWVNRELIHHTAEVALLRDLWRAGG